MSNKPLVFNYREYDTLRDKCNDMALEIEALKAEIERISGENIVLEGIIKTQKSTIDKYQQIFLLQEAELERLRHDS